MNTPNLKAVVRVSSAKMPSSVKASYVHVGVMLMDRDAPAPRMLSDRAKGCKAVIWEKRNLFSGKTSACAGARAQTEAAELAGQINEFLAALASW